MDPREPPQIPHHQHQHQHQHSMILGGAGGGGGGGGVGVGGGVPSSAYSNLNMMSPNNNNIGHHASAGGGGGFPFNSVGPPHQQPKPPSSSDVGGLFDGSSPPSSSGGMRFSMMEQSKKKRGRPRKYTPDGNIALGLSPTPISSASPTSLTPQQQPQQQQQHQQQQPQQQQHQQQQQQKQQQQQQQHGSSGGAIDCGSSGGVIAICTPGIASEPSSKKHRGRPPGSGKKQLDALGGVGGVGFTPHVITVKAGEDISSKIMAFSQQGPRTVCILSANGAICNVTLRQPAMSGGTVTYEGRFEIISLSGSFLLSENNGNRSRTGGLSVSLAGSDGRVLGGGVAGMLMAASPVQVIVGSFIADGKKSDSIVPISGTSSGPTSQMLNFGAPLTTASPPSQGVSSESSEENGGSPLNRDPQIYSNAPQPIHNMNNMYHHQLWAGQNQH